MPANAEPCTPARPPPSAASFPLPGVPEVVDEGRLVASGPAWSGCCVLPRGEPLPGWPCPPRGIVGRHSSRFTVAPRREAPRSSPSSLVWRHRKNLISRPEQDCDIRKAPTRVKGELHDRGARTIAIPPLFHGARAHRGFTAEIPSQRRGSTLFASAAAVALVPFRARDKLRYYLASCDAVVFVGSTNPRSSSTVRPGARRLQ